jgi:hypothetical protein
MKNRLSDLNDHLFAQLERLSDEGMTPEQIDREHKRGEAIVAVADQIVRNASLHLQAAKLAKEVGGDPMLHLLQLHHKRPEQLAPPKGNGRQ